MKPRTQRVQDVWGRAPARSTPAQLTLVVLDSPVRLDHVQRHSLLELPLGTGSLLDELNRAAEEAGCDRVLVLRTPDPVGAHGANGENGSNGHNGQNGHKHELPRAAAGKVVTPEEFAQFVRQSEPGDYLLIVDPGVWPSAGYDFEFVVRRSRSYRGAVHAISIGSHPGAFREQFDCDESGRIRRVQRLYNLVSWPETDTAALLCSLVPAQAVREIDCGHLPELRSRLMASGLFTQDVPVASDVLDLRTEEGILALSERSALAIEDEYAPPGWTRQAKGVLVGENCRIHPSCRFVPPVIVHAGARIEAGVAIVGPTVIGPNCRVQRDAFISHALLAGGTLVPSRAVVTRRAVEGSLAADGDYTGSLPVDQSVEAGAEHGVFEALSDLHRRKRFQFAAKRVLDVVLSAAGLIVLSPLLLLVALLVKRESSGPIFFVHRRERSGEKGDFPCIKFRTMVSDAHRRQREMYQQNEVDGPQFKMDYDPRITRLGQFLRSTNLDELPQLFNVLMGHMSLVGPRPSPFRENQICVPWRRARLSVRPGITGLWQLCRSDRHSGDFHQWIYYDMAYVRNFSLWLDLKILVLTILTRGGRKRVELSSLIPVERCG